MKGMLYLIAASLLAFAPQQSAYEWPPISYSRTEPADPAAGLKARIAAGQAALARDERHGYLPAFLSALNIPASSQMLVFSKTSFQRHRISPRSPRALYFNDDVYVGWVHGGEVLEVSAQDPQLGAVFYTLSQADDPPRLVRQTDNCLQCHDSSGLTLGVPGHIVRSVFAGGDGMPHLTMGTFRTTYRSPYPERWGGWYVTGRAGALRHMGNVTYREETDPDLKRYGERGANVTDLSGRVDLHYYPAGTSDIVALMVFEHQTHVHNLITRANYETRIAVRQSEDLNRMSGTPGGPLTEGARSRIRYVGEPLVEALLFSGEARLPDRVVGDSTFASDFEKRGPFDRQGRSLRQFDLEKRIFKHPCSYLVYSAALAGLPPEAKDYVSKRLHDVLSGADRTPPFEHLSPDDRAAVLAILIETCPELTAAWK